VLLCACAAALTARFQAALFCSPVPHAVEGSKLFSPPLRSRGVGESRGLPHLHAAHALRPQRVGPGVKRSALITVPLTIVNIAPPCLGFWRAEYGVSYGYGLAMALSGAWLLFAETRALSWAVALHVACLCIYGVRLSVFLLYRELCIPRFQEFRNRIEQRSKDRGTRLKRFPFLFCCGLLYLGLAAPASLAVAAADSVGKSALYQGAVALMYIGWFVAALADTWKSVAKSTQGQDALVTGGPFALLRHPNYTGEQLMWTASFVAGCCACASLPLRSSWAAEWFGRSWHSLRSYASDARPGDEADGEVWH